MINVENEILVYAVRYALGRQSGAVLDVVNSVHANVDNIEEKYKAVMLKDILEYLRMANDKYQYKDIIERALPSLLERDITCPIEYTYNLFPLNANQCILRI